MKKIWVLCVVTAALCMFLAACGSSGDSGTSGSNAPGGNASADKETSEWISADELQTILEKDYGYKNSDELTDMEDENNKTHREKIERDDGTTENFVDISYDGKTNKITLINWYYDMSTTDINYWVETLGLAVKNTDDLEAIKDVLSKPEEDIPQYENIELSNGYFFVQILKDDDYKTLVVYVNPE